MTTRRIGISVVLLVLLAATRAHFASTEPEPSISIETAAGVIATIAVGVDEQIGELRPEADGDATIYTDGNLRLRVTELPARAKSVIRVTVEKASGEPFRLNTFSVTAHTPRNLIKGIWYPGADPSSTNVMVADGNRVIEDISDANYGIPYIAAASLSSRNVFALGFGRQDVSVSLSGQPLGVSYEFRLKQLTARTAASFEESFYISTDPSMNWFEAASDYSNWVDQLNNYRPFPVSKRAYEPLYDTWYWTGDQVDHQLYIDTARLASQSGMGLFLADSGWDTDNGEWEKWLAGKTGDYAPPPQKFRDLAETFDEIRNEHKLGIDLWLQPFAVGRNSTRYSATRDMHIHLPPSRVNAMGWRGLDYPPFTLPLDDDYEEDVNLCPRVAATQTYLKALFTEVATKYKPQGYWLDFMDGMPAYCNARHAHDYSTFGQGFNQSLQTIKQTILENDPEAIVHFRARYANLNTKSFANVWQSGDSPADYDRMRLNSTRMRPFSKGVVFGADEMFWPDDTSEARVAKFIMTSVMVGVPAFGPTLIYSPPETFAMLKAWMGFYREHQLELATGTFSPFGQLSIPNHKIESGQRTFAYIRNWSFIEMPAEGSEIYLMNATNIDRFQGRIRPRQGPASYRIRVFNRFLVAEQNEFEVPVDARGYLSLNVAVQQGGMIQLTPIEK